MHWLFYYYQYENGAVINAIHLPNQETANL